MNIFNSILELNGYPIRKSLRLLERLNGLSGEEFKSFQIKSMRECLEHHVKTTPAFREMYGKIDPLSVRWESLPVMTKSIYQKEKNKLISDEYISLPLYRNSTSGSSGIPMQFVKDKPCHAMVWAHIIGSYRERGLEYGKSLQGRFYGMPLNSRKAFWKEKVKDCLSARVRFSAHDLGVSARKRILESFGRNDFTYVYGYANTLALFSRHMMDEGVCVKGVCPSIKCVIYTSEICTEDDRKVIEAAFGVRLYSEYGSSELGVLSFEDDKGRHVANDRQFFFEVLDESDEPVPDGLIGKLVVTSLFNRAMPFIRYELGDRAALARDGSRLYIHQLEGRTGELIKLPSGASIPSFALYTSTKMVTSKFPEIKEYYIKQTACDELTFELVVDGELHQAIERSVRETTKVFLPGEMRIQVRKVKEVQRTEAGKMRHFESCI